MVSGCRLTSSVNHTFITGDATDSNSYPSEGTVSAVFTSPRYNLGLDYGFRSDGSKIRDNSSEEDYKTELMRVFALAKKSCNEKAPLWLNVKGTDPRKLFSVLTTAESAGWCFQCLFVWVFSLSIGQTTHGHFSPNTRGINPHNGFELVLLFNQGDPIRLNRLAQGVAVPYMHKSNLKRFVQQSKGQAKPDARCRGNVWFVPPSSDLLPFFGESEARWWACLLDTDGSIYISKQKDKRKASPAYQTVVEVGLTSKKMLEHAQSLVDGFGSIATSPPKGIGRQDFHKLTIVGKQAACLLQAVYPYLILKKKQAALGIALDNRKHSVFSPGYKTKLSEEEILWRQRAWEASRALNSGGSTAEPDLFWLEEPAKVKESVDTLFVPYQTHQNRKVSHPCPFPADLVKLALAMTPGLEKGIVLDPYCGVGNVARASRDLGVSSWGIDLNPKYIDFCKEDFICESF